MMTEQASFTLRNRNPDVLTCIANLSNDEVFTPPELANQMLDMLADAWAKDHKGANIWENKDVKFLDPCTKSGVFLREITARLTQGLEKKIPNLEKRVDHILSKQVYGIGITKLTSLLARRSVYCSKNADGEHSITKSFKNSDGNIWFQRTEHEWTGGSCLYCGASQITFGRGNALESYAYAFIHSKNVKKLIRNLFGEDMQFDVIIGNPPYQMADGGGEGASAIPLYHQFVMQAKQLESKQLVMVIPARWYSGGKGLDEFRDNMLTDGKLAEIHDFQETDLVFPGVNIRGGVCYFRWAKSHQGPATITNYSKEHAPSTSIRNVLESGLGTFVRYNEAISILQKVRIKNEPTYDTKVQSRNPFGIPSNFTDFSTKKDAKSSILLFRSRRGSSADKTVYVSADKIASNKQFKDKIKVLVSKASPGGDEYPHAIFSTPLVAPINSVATETYLIVDFVNSEEEAKNMVAYMRTKFFRFLVSLIKTTQNISKGSFAFVPIQDLSVGLTDAVLYKKYGITKDEQAFIDKMIRPMSLEGEADE
jgi:site-specific DNA-methyltransferase (adenine-specific)